MSGVTYQGIPIVFDSELDREHFYFMPPGFSRWTGSKLARFITADGMWVPTGRRAMTPPSRGMRVKPIWRFQRRQQG